MLFVARWIVNSTVHAYVWARTDPFAVDPWAGAAPALLLTLWFHWVAIA